MVIKPLENNPFASGPRTGASDLANSGPQWRLAKVWWGYNFASWFLLEGIYPTFPELEAELYRPATVWRWFN